ncbi:MAG: transglutaminase-like cysteine peptidase [Xanthobacteraceae bacterium]|nr:transglutaminase-like cysteine peptidase [Xanthobacteraceae bacterium]
MFRFFENRRLFLILFPAAAATCGFSANANARSRFVLDTPTITMINEGSPSLAPFQHVRFCLKYPIDCKNDLASGNRIELDDETMALLKRVNHRVNASIQPRTKSYGDNLGDGWSISPYAGDCNDYAVTKRHELLTHGFPSHALRLSVVRTAWGEGHLVLTVATTKGDYVLDNLTESIRPWQNTNYQWVKVQSASNPKFWNQVGSLVVNASVLKASPLKQQAKPDETDLAPAPQIEAGNPSKQNEHGAEIQLASVREADSVLSCAGLLAETPLVL